MMGMRTIILIAFLCAGCTSAEPGEFASGRPNPNMPPLIEMSVKEMFPDTTVRSLAVAAGKGRPKRIDELVSSGADVNARGTYGATPLFWALRSSSLVGFGHLLDLGADPNITFNGSSVMHWAAMHRSSSFLRLALMHGGDPNLRAGDRAETPLFKSIRLEGAGDEESMTMLLDAGANIDAQTQIVALFGAELGGKTPILLAADVLRYDLVLELLERGADYQVKDGNGLGLFYRIEEARKLQFLPGSKQSVALGKVENWLAQHSKVQRLGRQK